MTKNEAAAEVLRKLMSEHGLTQREVAEMATVSVKTVEGWLANRGAASYRSMPARHINVIRMMLPRHLAARRSRKDTS